MDDLDPDSVVALVGMSGRFPGAADVTQLWRNLAAGAGGLRTITPDELRRAGIDPDAPGCVPVGGPLDGVELFDAAAFGATPAEAETMEPQHRLFLECAWEALERAGYCPTEPGGTVGVFGGCAFPDYMIDNVLARAADPATAAVFASGNERDSLTSLVAWKLGLTGPAVTVQTFCSTSLVAVHLACQSLLTFECDLALAGGAHVPLPQPAGYRPAEGGILSPSGQVRSLDAGADGTVMGAGVGVVALRRLSDALAGGDVIHAVLRGSAINNDGRARAGYSAPGLEGQAEVVAAALAVADVKPETVGYVECHAVGTPLGDSIEIAALGRAFPTPRATPCVLSSVKPAIGHLDRAAGVTALIRAALHLRHATLPGTPGHRTPNAALDAVTDRFTVLPADRPWPAGPEPRRAGVSAFGVGGTNAHVVLEEAPARAARPPSSGPYLLAFSAADPAALDELTERLARHLDTHRDTHRDTDRDTDRDADRDADLADVAHTLAVSRGRFPLRRAVVCTGHADAVAALRDPARHIDGETRHRDRPVTLTAGPDVPAAWWSDLAAAAGRLSGEDPGENLSAAVGGPAALAAGLRAVGVRIVDVAAAGTVDVLVEPGAGTAAEWLLATLARLRIAGARLDVAALSAALHGDPARRVELPTYPFQRSRHWVERDPGRAREASPEPGVVVPGWVRSPLPVADLDARLRAAGPWLVLAADPVGDAVVARLERAGAEVVTGRPGTVTGVDPLGHGTVAPGGLAALMAAQVVAPRTVVHGFGLAPAGPDDLAQAMALTLVPDVDVVLLTRGAVGVLGTDLDRPDRAALGALAAGLGGRHVDLGPGGRSVPAADLDQALAAAVAPSTAGRPADGDAAVRDGAVWVRHDVAAPQVAAALGAGDTVLVCGAPQPGGIAAGAALVHTDLADVTAAPDALVHVVRDDSGAGPDTAVRRAVAEFEQVRAALGERVPARCVVVGPEGGDPVSAAVSGAVAAHAGRARRQGPGSWTWVERAAGCAPDDVRAAVDLALAAGDHLDRLVVTGRPAPSGAPDHHHGPARVQPAAGTEHTLAALWADELGLPEVGAEDNFFALGGRSMAAVALASRIGRALGVALPATALLEHPTVRGLATAVDQLRTEEGTSS